MRKASSSRGLDPAELEPDSQPLGVGIAGSIDNIH
jgi:hypothetical protein